MSSLKDKYLQVEKSSFNNQKMTPQKLSHFYRNIVATILFWSNNWTWYTFMTFVILYHIMQGYIPVITYVLSYFSLNNKPQLDNWIKHILLILVNYWSTHHRIICHLQIYGSEISSYIEWFYWIVIPNIDLKVNFIVLKYSALPDIFWIL